MPYHSICRFVLAARNTRFSSGFSLIECVATLCIISILTAAGSPYLLNYIKKTALLTTSSKLQQSLMMARQHAITHQVTVHVCLLSGPSSKTCGDNKNHNTSWSYGWLVYADNNNNNQLDSSTELLRTEANTNDITIVFNQRGRLRFFSNGSARSAGFYLCSTYSKQARHIKLLFTGRVRTAHSMTKKQKNICLSKAN